MSAIPEVLQTALATKVKDEVQPVKAMISHSRAILEVYEKLFVADAERKAVGAMLAALGQPVPEPDPKLKETADIARTSLEALLAHLGKAPVVPVCVPVPAAPEPPPPPSAPRVADPVTIDTAWKLIREIDDTDYVKMHPLRLLPLLRAQVAECRLYMDKLPNDHDLQEHLNSAIRYLGRVRSEQMVEGYIKGLAYHHKEDWAKLSADGRWLVSKYDKDTETPLSTPKGNGKKVNGKDEPEKVAYQWPEMPYLRSRIKDGRGVLLVGGFKRDEKLRLVQERFGIEPEWYETDPNCPKMSEDAVNRVKGGKVVAVVLLNGFMTHKDFKRVSDVCEAVGIPCTTGERGGVASLESAFVEIERQCSSI